MVFSGALLKEYSNFVDMYTAKGKVMYKGCVKALNRCKLNGRVDTVWRQTLELDDGVKPIWRVLYKPPIKKRTGDLQWRILHGVIAVNSFISMINPTVSSSCPFCDKVETIFHCFYECKRLCNLFNVLENMFLLFGEEWSKTVFILGAGYSNSNSVKWQLLNLIVGEAKLSIYCSRKNKVEGKEGQEAVPIFRALMKARIWVEYRFFKEMNDIDEFMRKWCYDDALCSVVNDELIFNLFFR